MLDFNPGINDEFIIIHNRIKASKQLLHLIFAYLQRDRLEIKKKDICLYEYQVVVSNSFTSRVWLELVVFGTNKLRSNVS